MNLELSFFLGILQGVTEFLPVSSSGHLALFEVFFAEKELLQKMLQFDVVLHFGSLFALLLYFRKDLKNLLFGIFKKNSKEQKLSLTLIFATIPTVVFGFFAGDFLEAFSHSLSFLFFTFLFSAFYFFLSEHFYKKKKLVSEVSFKNGILIGISQAAAVLPGISRSGTTLSTGILLGIERGEALRFSFLLGIPIIFGAIFYLCLKHGFNFLETFGAKEILIGFSSSFFFSLVSIHFLIGFFKKFSLKIFAFYLLVLSFGILFFLILKN